MQYDSELDLIGHQSFNTDTWWQSWPKFFKYASTLSATSRASADVARWNMKFNGFEAFPL